MISRRFIRAKVIGSGENYSPLQSTLWRVLNAQWVVDIGLACHDQHYIFTIEANNTLQCYPPIHIFSFFLPKYTFRSTSSRITFLTCVLFHDVVWVVTIHVVTQLSYFQQVIFTRYMFTKELHNSQNSRESNLIFNTIHSPENSSYIWG